MLPTILPGTRLSSWSSCVAPCRTRRSSAYASVIAAVPAAPASMLRTGHGRNVAPRCEPLRTTMVPYVTFLCRMNPSPGCHRHQPWQTSRHACVLATDDLALHPAATAGTFIQNG